MEPSILALACLAGAGVGWILRDFLGKRSLDPNMGRIYYEDLQRSRAEYERMLQSERQARHEERATLQTLLVQLGGEQATRDLTQAHPPTFTTREGGIPPDGAVAQGLAQGLGVPDKAATIRRALVERAGLTEEEVNSILSGEFAALEGHEQADLIVNEALKTKIGAT